MIIRSKSRYHSLVPLQVIRLLEDSSEQAVRLRKNSPFVSLLSTPEQQGAGTGSE